MKTDVSGVDIIGSTYYMVISNMMLCLGCYNKKKL